MLTLIRNLSLKWKMAFSSSLILLAAMAVVWVYFSNVQDEALRSGIQAKVKAVANTLAATIAPAIQLGQTSGLDEVLKAASADKELLALSAEDAARNRIAGFQDCPAGGKGCTELRTDLKPTKAGEPVIEFSGHVLHAALQIDDGSSQGTPNVLGTLRLAYSLTAYEELRTDGQRTAALISLTLFLIGTLLVALVGMRFGSMIRSMAATFRRMAEGDLTQDLIANRSKDEMGQLAQAYNDLLRQLRDLSEQARYIAQGDLSRDIDRRGELAEAFRAMKGTFSEIAVRFDELSVALDDRTSAILTTTRQQEAGAAQQASTVSEVTATMGELAATARQIARNAESVTESAEQAASTVNDGRKALSAFVASIGDIENGNRIINDNIVTLNRHVQQIGGIIDLINDIADRSDLLALNAALEGTKAGEAGKGFLLVAAEMRRLAENVFNSTAEIKQLIAEVTEATNSTVMATESGVKATRKGVSLAEEAERSFDRIVQTIEATTQAAKQISVATQQQHTGTDQIVSAMAEVSDVAQQSLDGIRQTAQSVGELSTMASALRKMIAKYKLEKRA